MEETGEVGEVMLHELGFLKHKDKEFEPLVEECADVINVLTGILSLVYPKMSPQELSLMLLEALNKKGAKYARLMDTDDYFNE